MKVLLFSPVSIEQNGGAELYLLHLATFLKGKGHTVRPLTGLPQRRFLRWSMLTLSAQRQLINAFKWADLVYCSYGFAGFDWLLVSLSEKTGTPVIAGHHAPLLHHDALHNLWMHTGGRFLLRKFAGHHVLNHDHERLLRRWGIKNVFFVPCGIDRKMFSPKGKGPHRLVRFLFVGRPGWQKGLDILEGSIASLSSKNQARCVFRIIGCQHPDVPRISNSGSCSIWAHREMQYFGRVRHQEIPKHMRWADVVIVPSREETSPAVVLEALASGRPVLGGDIPGIRDPLQQYPGDSRLQVLDSEVARTRGDRILHPGGAGWLVKAGSVEALAEGIASVVREFTRRPQQWITMSRSARQASKAYDHRGLFERLMGFFTEFTPSSIEGLRMTKQT